MAWQICDASVCHSVIVWRSLSDEVIRSYVGSYAYMYIYIEQRIFYGTKDFFLSIFYFRYDGSGFVKFHYTIFNYLNFFRTGVQSCNIVFFNYIFKNILYIDFFFFTYHTACVIGYDQVSLDVVVL